MSDAPGQKHCCAKHTKYTRKTSPAPSDPRGCPDCATWTGPYYLEEFWKDYLVTGPCDKKHPISAGTRVRLHSRKSKTVCCRIDDFDYGIYPKICCESWPLVIQDEWYHWEVC
jgi:hypothetical protein